CVRDADATWLLYRHVLAPLLERYPEVQRYHQEEFLWLDLLLIEQRSYGLLIDVPALEAHRDHLIAELRRAELAVRRHPEVLPHVLRRRLTILDDLCRREPPKYKKVPLPGPEPARWKPKKFPKEPAKLR